MSPEFWEWMDTVAKIGLGAAIAGISTYIVTRLQHRQTVEQAAVRRRLELIEEITEGVQEYGNTITRYCYVTEKILNAHYQPDSTIGEVPAAWVDERSALIKQLESGAALKKPEGLLLLIAADGKLPKILSELHKLAQAVLNEASQVIQDVDPHTLNSRLFEFQKCSAHFVMELGKVYRKPTI